MNTNNFWILITHDPDGTTSTSVFRKETYLGLYLKWQCYVPKQFKTGLVRSLINRAWRICSNETLYNKEVNFIKSNLSANGYPLNFLNSCRERFRCQKTKTDSLVFGLKGKILLSNYHLKENKVKFSKGNCVDCLQLIHGLELLLYWMPLTKWANSPSWVPITSNEAKQINL